MKQFTNRSLFLLVGLFECWIVQSQELKFQFVPECFVTQDAVGFHIRLESHYTKPESYSSSQIYSVTCKRDTRECSGVRLPGDGKLSFFSVIEMTGAKIIGQTKSVFTIQWGPFRQFVYDSTAGTVSFSESSENSEGRALSKCK